MSFAAVLCMHISLIHSPCWCFHCWMTHCMCLRFLQPTIFMAIVGLNSRKCTEGAEVWEGLAWIGERERERCHKVLLCIQSVAIWISLVNFYICLAIIVLSHIMVQVCHSIWVNDKRTRCNVELRQPTYIPLFHLLVWRNYGFHRAQTKPASSALWN